MPITISITPPPDPDHLATMRRSAAKRGGRVVIAGGFAMVLERNPGICADCGRWDSHVHEGLCAEHFAADRNLDRDVELARFAGGAPTDPEGGPDGPPPAA